MPAGDDVVFLTPALPRAIRPPAPAPPQVSEFFDEAKGDALNAVETSVALEKLNFLKLRWGARVRGVGGGGG